MKNFLDGAKAFIGLGDELGQENETDRSEDKIGKELSPFKRSSKKVADPDFEIAIYEPKAYEDSIAISAKLRQGSPVIVNLKYLDSSDGTRLVDFVCGTAFAIDGHMMKISDGIFLLTPSEVAISDFAEKAQSDGKVVREGLLHRS